MVDVSLYTSSEVLPTVFSLPENDCKNQEDLKRCIDGYQGRNRFKRLLVMFAPCQGPVAQWNARCVGIAEAAGSNPVRSTFIPLS